jgi:hypothetical protein
MIVILCYCFRMLYSASKQAKRFIFYYTRTTRSNNMAINIIVLDIFIAIIIVVFGVVAYCSSCCSSNNSGNSGSTGCNGCTDTTYYCSTCQYDFICELEYKGHNCFEECLLRNYIN